MLADSDYREWKVLGCQTQSCCACIVGHRLFDVCPISRQ